MEKGLKILLVEDRPEDAELIRIQLRKAGFDFEFNLVDTQPDFLAALKETRWDLIISDYKMPEFDGLTAFQLLRDSNLDIPFIFVSGTLGEHQAVEAMRAGARDYLLKGDLTRLPEVVRREINEAENRRAQRAAAEKAIADQQRIAMAVEATGLGFFEFATDNSIPVSVNQRFSEIIGYSLEEIQQEENVASWFLSHVPSDEFEAVQKQYNRFISGEIEEVVIEMPFIRKDETRIHITTLAKATKRNEDGRAIQVLGGIIDITESKNLETQFRQAQKMEAMGRLAGGVAHDFNNLLTIIISYGDIIANEFEGNEKLTKNLEQIIKAAQKAGKLTEQLLTFTRRRSVAPRVINPNEAIRDFGKMIERLIDEDITFVFNAGENVGNVQIDPVAFEQVVMNLVVNARDAMPNGGNLFVETTDVTLSSEVINRGGKPLDPGDYVMINISDTGKGIPAKIREKIFEPFFTTKEIGKGTGLGLSTCLGIINQAGGFISVYSELEEGTTFKILLPRVQKKVEGKQAASAPVSLSGSETIVIAEDDQQLRELIVHVLGKWGYDVHFASNGRDALDIFKSLDKPVDLLVTDMIMPVMSGKELVDTLLKTQPDLKVLFLSGYPTNVMAEKGVQMTDINLLQKPFAPGDLVKKIRLSLDS